MTSQELKNKFFQYFEAKNHKIIGSTSLLPDNDPTALFTTAGMHPLVPYLMGEKHPEGKRLANVQKCLRTGDIDEVGDAIHHTFFEMLGNWSLGDYFKKEAIAFSWEFLTEVLKLEKEKLAVSVFGGNSDIAQYDNESEKYWLELEVPQERIARVSDNWWGPAGSSGPCGPDTEMFYWISSDPAPNKFNPEDARWVEIWNDVLMQYNKTTEGKFENLNQKNIDTGMGLERTLAVLNGLDDNYQTELFLPIIAKLEELSGKKYETDKRSFRIIADHIRSAVFVLGDEKGLAPSNKDQGYVLRRLIRRAIRFGKKLGIENNFCQELAIVVIDNYQEAYPELSTNRQFISDELEKEENKFRQTLEKGLKEVRNIFEINRTLGKFNKNPLDGKMAFDLFQTHGFPLELVLEEIENLSKIYKYNFKIDKEKISREFNKKFQKHQELSRTASAGHFKGGLADDNYNTKRHHSSSHLLLEALKMVLGREVSQKGSNINQERVRFDFSYPEKLTAEQIKQIENIVNEQIKKSLPVHFKEMSLEKAKEIGATGVFDHKYGDKVKVYFMGGFSKEICGGPHVDNTSELGHFRIIKEESSSAGVRRIKAILE